MKKTILAAIAVISVLAMLSAIGIAARIVLFPAAVVENSINMAYDVMSDTLTAENAIYNYEWFKQQEADIRRCIGNEAMAQEEYDTYLAALPGNAADWSRFQQQEEASLRNSLSALKRITNKAIEDYNARASMANRNIFNDNLPSNMTRAFYAGFELIK